MTTEKSFAVLAGVVCATILVGCGTPALQQTPLTPMEQDWAEMVQKDYPSWEPPHTVSPVIYTLESQSPRPSTMSPGVPAAAMVEASEAEEAMEDVYTMEAVELEVAPVAETEEIPVAEEVAEEAPAVVEEAPAEEFEIYEVQKGDSLSKIAAKFYGRQNWQKIADANQDILKGSTVIKPGMKLKVPKK